MPRLAHMPLSMLSLRARTVVAPIRPSPGLSSRAPVLSLYERSSSKQHEPGLCFNPSAGETHTATTVPVPKARADTLHATFTVAAASRPASSTQQPARSDVPRVRNVDRADAAAAWKMAQTEAGRTQMLLEYDRDTYSHAGHVVRQAQLQTWESIHSLWMPGVPMLPLTAEKVRYVGAHMKRAGYRSWKNYASRARDAHVSAGHVDLQPGGGLSRCQALSAQGHWPFEAGCFD